MSIAIDFESRLLKLLKNEGSHNIEIKKNIDYSSKYPKENIKTEYIDKKEIIPEYENKKINPKYENKDYNSVSSCLVPPASSLFIGIFIGVGMASHALIVKWK